MINDIENLQFLPSLLLPWFYSNNRKLPWRINSDPYRVWVSEIMLQQTRVQTVIDRYSHFLESFPDVYSLAYCSEDRLLKEWEGLGYYNRARNMRLTAQIIVSQYGGVFPDDYDNLVRLPGIGPYTAGAIASIAYNKKVPAVDGNVLRVLSRYIASNNDVKELKTGNYFKEILFHIIPNDAGSFAQALMDIGELVCIPNGVPQCDECPLNNHCIAHATHSETKYPIRLNKSKRTIQEISIFVFWNNKKQYFLNKRSEEGLLGGLWEFPNISYHFGDGDLKETLSNEYGIETYSLRGKQSYKHIFSHFEWIINAYYIEVFDNSVQSFELAYEDEIDKHYPLPTAFKKLMK